MWRVWAIALAALISGAAAGRDVPSRLRGDGGSNETADGSPTRAVRAIAYAGGGFRALAVDIGLTTALLAAKARKDNVTPSLAGTRLWDQFDIVSSVSGSTWFLASLAFSKRFQDMIERMALAPESAGLEFHNDWMQSWISVGHGKRNDTADDIDLATVFADASGGAKENVLQQNLREFSFFWRRGMCWNDFVHQMLLTTSHLDSHHSLGDAVEPWLVGKVWLVCHSLVVGSQQKQAHLTRGLGKSAHYFVAPGGLELPVYLPAKYSVVMGSGGDADAPYPYIAEGVASGRRLEYTGSTRFGLQRVTDYSDVLENLGKSAARRAGSVPITGSVSASSAFAGGICLSRTLSTAQGILGTQLTTFAALSVDAAHTFRRATSAFHELEDKGISRGRMRVAARSGLVAIIDACYTDDSGVAQAVGSGADEVSMVVYGLASLHTLYQTGKGYREVMGIPIMQIPIFAEHLDEEKMFEDVHKMWLTPRRKFLQDITTFTLRGTTIDSALFGINAGRNVTLRVFFVSTKLAIGSVNDYDCYCAFVQEMLESLLAEDNQHRVENWLLEYF